jgi:hypothetical protein
MSEIHLAVEMMFISDQPATDDQFEAFLDEVVNQLENIGCEVSLAARLSDRVADFAATITASDFSSAATTFIGDLRTALHAAGCNTANWPRFQAGEHVIRELQDV